MLTIMYARLTRIQALQLAVLEVDLPEAAVPESIEQVPLKPDQWIAPGFNQNCYIYAFFLKLVLPEIHVD